MTTKDSGLGSAHVKSGTDTRAILPELPRPITPAGWTGTTTDSLGRKKAEIVCPRCGKDAGPDGLQFGVCRKCDPKAFGHTYAPATCPTCGQEYFVPTSGAPDTD